MATFARPTFSTANYAAARPSYPQSLYTFILSKHHGACTHLLDLGTGHGIVARQLAPHFSRVTACDPSAGMLAQARSASSAPAHAHIAYRAAGAEALPFLADGSVDAATAAQAAHWFDFARAWPELARVVRRGGTLAFWGYGATGFPAHPRATAVVLAWAFAADGEIARYWPQPGAGIVDNMYRDILPPEGEWEEVSRIVHEPRVGPAGETAPELAGLRRVRYRDEEVRRDGPLQMDGTRSVADVRRLFYSWSATKEWAEAHPGPEHKSRADGGAGDVIDRMFDDIIEADPAWKDPDLQVRVEVGTCLIVARRT